jgi:predicted deacylase
VTQALDRKDYLLAPESGIFEASVDLGTPVRAGDLIGSIHFLERQDRAAEPIVAAGDGYVITLRVPCSTQQGDCVAVIAKPVSMQDVMES